MGKACILGAGSWGTALAVLLANNGHDVYLWGRIEDGLEDIYRRRENLRFLPGVKIPSRVNPTADLNQAISCAGTVVLSVPSQAMRSVLVLAKSSLSPGQIIVNTAKGLELESGLRMSQVAQEVLGGWIQERYAVLSGPSHAEEVALELPTAVTVAACRPEIARQVQDLFMSPVFRVYTNPDIAGVELGGALKNIIAVATGIAYGLGYGDNTMAALLTRGLAEIVRMGKELGGNPRTFSGLSGIGDLVVTCGSRHSRNRRAGEFIGQGLTPEEALEKVGMVVEGAYTCSIANRLALERGVEMPITRACHQVLYEGRKPGEAVRSLMQRQKKQELEDLAENLPGWI